MLSASSESLNLAQGFMLLTDWVNIQKVGILVSFWGISNEKYPRMKELEKINLIILYLILK